MGHVVEGVDPWHSKHLFGHCASFADLYDSQFARFDRDCHGLSLQDVICVELFSCAAGSNVGVVVRVS